MAIYRLKKSKTVLFHVFRSFLKRRKSLSPLEEEILKRGLHELEDRVLAKDKEGASLKAQELEKIASVHLKRGLFGQIRDFVLGMLVALFFALIIRQTWFELYQIPTGSMRPTFKEYDRLVVSKTDFGINVPFKTKHFYFDPNCLKRNSIVIFTAENMDIKDADTVYFYLFPGKKQLIKRLIGKPGDTLYFYGGKVYGIDQDQKDITPLLQSVELSRIEHIPFINFEGKVSLAPQSSQGVYSSAILYQMNKPVARLYTNADGTVKGDLSPDVLLQNPNATYASLWGFENFATARLLTKDQASKMGFLIADGTEDTPLFLELRHHPDVSSAKLGFDAYNRLRPQLGFSTSVIPLKIEHLKAIFDNMYTSRFVVHNGLASRFSLDSPHSIFAPSLSKVPDGTYEFYYGQPSIIKWQGLSLGLPEDHPLRIFSPSRTQTLFNLGVELDTRFAPQSSQQTLVPARYAYFREGDLYLMGAPIIRKEDKTLIEYVESELAKQQGHKGYTPFIDRGSPLNPDQTINVDFIQLHGLKVPSKTYLVLGDNHSNSGDSREFGFVPEENLRGGPTFIFSPPGERFGRPNQPPYPVVNLGSFIVWSVGLLSIGAWILWQRKKYALPLKF